MKLPTWLSKSKQIADNIWGLLCLIAVPSLCTLAGVWYFAPAKGATIELRSVPSIYVQPGERTRILSSLEVKIPSEKMIYRFALVDNQGKIAYEWPLKACLDTLPPNFSDVTVKVPNITGDYQLVANVTYKINPIKNNDIQVKVARLSIGTN